MANGDTKTESYLRAAAEGTRADLPSDTCCNTKTQNLILGVANRIMDVEDEVEEMKNNPDVADIVATYADLQAYDKSKLTDKDIIRVLADETHNNDSTYYRYDKSTNAFTYIGESKQYTNFVGTDGTTAGASGLVPAPATTDEGKYLKADGTWDTVQAGPTVVQTTGTSTTDVMSQNATSSMVFNDPSTKRTIQIGDNAVSANYSESVSIGRNALASGSESVSIGKAAGLRTPSTVNQFVAIGYGAGQDMTGTTGSVSLGAYSKATRRGEVNIGSTDTSYGYNNTSYRILGGVHDPVDAHDAATKGYVDANAGGVTTLTSADYNFPASSPSVIAGWLLPVGQYIIAPNTDFLPDGNSPTYKSDQEIGVLVLTQTPNNSYATYICSVYDGENLYKTQANGTPASGYPHVL